MATTTLQENFRTVVEGMQAIVTRAKAERRDLTAAEIAEIDRKSVEADQIKAKIEQARKYTDLIRRVGQVTSEAENPGAEPGVGVGGGFGQKALAALKVRAGDYGVKSLVGTSVEVPSPIVQPVTSPEVPRTVLDLIPRKLMPPNLGEIGSSSAAFSYARQTVRTNNAAAVADGGTKPTSVYTFNEVSDRLRVYAHVSEAVPERFLSDDASLIRILGQEMAVGVQAALEADAVDGDGSGEGFTGILNTSGIESQVAVGTDLLATLSAAYVDLVTVAVTPTAWLLHPTDWAKLSLMRESGTTGALMFGAGRSTLTAIIGDAPLIPTTAITAGTVLVGDFQQTLLVDRGDANLKMYQDAGLIEKNQIKFRFEGRFGFQVLRPGSFVKVTLPV